MSFRRTANASEAAIKLYLTFDPDDVYPTEGDVIYALERQKTRILTRTARGVDYEERPFAPYNSTRPYYYYPNGPVGRVRSANETARARAGVRRFARKLGNTSGITRSRLGLKFPSYQAYKSDYLGRSNVDMTGPRAPHMLQQIVSEAGGHSFLQSVDPALGAFPTRALTGSIGIYGEAGIRAQAHNDGAGRQPQRRFFASSDRDTTDFGNDLQARVYSRLSTKRGLPNAA